MLMRETDGYSVTDFTPVEYIESMGDDNAVCDAARVSFDKAADGYTPEQNARLLHFLADHNHWSPFAHASIKFRLRAPIFIARQFQKHQVGFAWNEVSRRYVDKDITFFVPHSWRQRPDSIKQGSVVEGEKELAVGSQYLESYKLKMREAAKDYRELRLSGVAPEQVRMILPQSMMTEWIWTGSLMAWSRFIGLRAEGTAQMECHPYASEVLSTMARLFPRCTAALQGYDLKEANNG